MSKGKYSEAEMIGALKQLEAGRTPAEVAANWVFPSTRCMLRRPSTGG